MSPRPLVFVSGLTFGDYLLWSWSLDHNHDILALVSGLTLPPLAVAWVWLLVLALARIAARLLGRPAVRLLRGRPAAETTQPEATGGDVRPAPAPAATVSADARSGKLAA